MKFSSRTASKILILTFPTLFLVIFFLIPLLKIIFLAFDIQLDDSSIFSLSHLFNVITHPLNQYFLVWDLQQAFITTIICLLVGIPGSYLLAHYSFPAKRVLRNLLTIPFILPPIVVLIGFIAVFGHGSWINQTWKTLTGNLLIDIYNTYEGVILAHIFYNIPVIIRLTEIGWKTIDPEVIDVARSLKASKWRIFWKIQFPQLFPIVAAASLLVFIYAFNSFAIVLVLGGVKFQTLEVRIYDLAYNRFNYYGAAALTLVQIFINVILILFYLYYSNKYEIPTTKTINIREKPLISSSMKFKQSLEIGLVLGYFLILGIICILPIIGVFIASFTTREYMLTLANYETLFDRNLRDFIGISPENMVLNSLLFGVVVMFVASILALLLNYGLNYETTYKGTPKLTLLQSFTGIIVILPLTISSVTLAFSLFSLYRFTPIYENIAPAIIVAQTLVAFPFANRIIAATRANIDPTTINVALSLGASRLRAFLKIEMPILISGIIVAGLFSFAISIGEFGATNFLSQANFATIPVGIYRLIGNARNPGAAASFSAILVLITVVCFIIIERFGSTEFRI